MTANIGGHSYRRTVALAPMAGISDRPFRDLCRQFGVDYCVVEMITSRQELWHSEKTRRRLLIDGEQSPRIVQIAGSDPATMALAARRAQDLGADVIDLNMGCPAKKVCNKQAGSALLQDEGLVADILNAVIAAVTLPVTLKMRTGWSRAHRNGARIAMIAEDCGVSRLVVHGRTRECAFGGRAEYDTIAEIKSRVEIPVIANGDIDCGTTARRVLEYTAADGVMIGRAARGNPWVLAEVKSYLAGDTPEVPARRARLSAIAAHVAAMHAHYGNEPGARIARKHVGWYLHGLGETKGARAAFNQLPSAAAQLEFIDRLAEFEELERAA